MKDFGAELKKARESASVTLDEIFEKTRISIKHLRAIEAGDFPGVPQTYVRAFIREYARIVGLDEEETIRKYNQAAEKERGIPLPPSAIDSSNLLPHLDETIEILTPASPIPRHVEVAGIPEVEKEPLFVPPVRRSPSITMDTQAERRTEAPSQSPPAHEAPAPQGTGIRSAGAAPPSTPRVTPARIEPTPDDAEAGAKTFSPSAEAPTRAASIVIDAAASGPPAHTEEAPAAPRQEAQGGRREDLRSEIFRKFLPGDRPTAAAPTEQEQRPRPRPSVYDTKPPIPAEEPQTAALSSKGKPAPPRTEESEQKRILLVGSIILLMVVVVVAGFFYFGSRNESMEAPVDSTAINAAMEASTFVDSTQMAFTEPAPLPADTAKTENPPEEKLLEPSLKIYARDDSLLLEAFSGAPVWFSIKMDTTRSERGTLGSNDHRSWKARDRFVVTLGDAGAVTFFLNGKEIGRLGEEGSVLKNVVLTRQNLRKDL